MTNGNGDEWQPPTDQGDQDQSVPQTTGGGGDNQSSGMSPIGEGWGEGHATFDEVVDNVKAFFEAFKGPLLFAWLAYAGLMLLLETFEVGLYVTGWALGMLGGFFGGLLSLVLAPLLLLISFAATAGQLTLYGPIRERVFHGIEPESWTDGLKQGLQRIVPVGLAVFAIGLLTSFGLILCILPGLAFAFFTLMAPYLLATRGDTSLGGAFTRSYELAKKYWQVLAITIGALFAAGLVAGCFMGVGGGLATVLPEPLGTIISQYAGWVGMTAFQFGIFVVWGGVFVTIDSHESGESLQTANFDVEQEW